MFASIDQIISYALAELTQRIVFVYMFFGIVVKSKKLPHLRLIIFRYILLCLHAERCVELLKYIYYYILFKLFLPFLLFK